MLKFYQQRSLRGWLHTRVFIGFLGLVCLFMATIVYERYSIEQEMIGRRVEAEDHLKQLESRRADLEKKVEYLSNDRGIEAEMRRNFDVARPGEQVVIILDDEKKDTIEPLPKTTIEEAPWYKFW
jgi:cell division protein FtsB